MPRKARKMTGSRGALDELRAHMRKHEQIAGHNSEGTKRVRADQPGPTCRGQRGVSTCAPPPTQSEELKGTASTDLGDVVVLREVLELFVELCDTLLVRLDGRLCRLFEELRAVRGCPWGQSWAGWRAAAREGRTRLRWTSSKRRWASVLPDAATLVLLLALAPPPPPPVTAGLSLRSCPLPLADTALSRSPSSRAFLLELDFFFFFFLCRCEPGQGSAWSSRRA